MEKLLWSIALPGFGQYLNGKFLKGTVLIFLEFLINVQSHFNEVIILSFHGQIKTAIGQTNYEWLMFYPCVYLFAAWDAYRDDTLKKHPFVFFPFVFAAFSVTVGLIFSPSFKLMGHLWGPVWLPISFLIPGIVIGLFLKFLFKRWD